MPSDHPQTPQSPSQASFSAADLPAKPVTSPRHTHSLPTPAHSINGSMFSINPDTTSEAAPHDESSNKRKRDPEDHGDREQKKVHVEDSRISIEDLHLDVGEKYLLCRTPHTPIQPSFSQDLFKLYGLDEIAQTVARPKADGTGNKLRKTYKNFMKNLGLSGNFEPDKKELGAPDTLWAMIDMGEEEWNQKHVGGKEVSNGLSKIASDSMGKAFAMARGTIPKSAWDSSVLGEVAASAAASQPPKSVHNGAKTPHTQNAAGSQAAKDALRPKRNVKKRAYGDSSFEGYGEGYVDDDMQEMGYSTGDGEDRGGGRKRPKKTAQSNFQQGAMRQNSYGPGMVGA